MKSQDLLSQSFKTVSQQKMFDSDQEAITISTFSTLIFETYFSVPPQKINYSFIEHKISSELSHQSKYI